MNIRNYFIALVAIVAFTGLANAMEPKRSWDHIWQRSMNNGIEKYYHGTGKNEVYYQRDANGEYSSNVPFVGGERIRPQEGVRAPQRAHSQATLQRMFESRRDAYNRAHPAQ